jgi:RNA polymerase sigma-70 factor (ECF subfamily)
VVVLRDIEGLSYEEIAQVLELELGTVRSRLHRARADLKEKLERFLP